MERRELGEWRSEQERRNLYERSDPDTWQRIQDKADRRQHPIWGLMFRLPQISDLAVAGQDHMENRQMAVEKPGAQRTAGFVLIAGQLARAGGAISFGVRAASARPGHACCRTGPPRRGNEPDTKKRKHNAKGKAKGKPQPKHKPAASSGGHMQFVSAKEPPRPTRPAGTDSGRPAQPEQLALTGRGAGASRSSEHATRRPRRASELSASRRGPRKQPQVLPPAQEQLPTAHLTIRARQASDPPAPRALGPITLHGLADHPAGRR